MRYRRLCVLGLSVLCLGLATGSAAGDAPAASKDAEALDAPTLAARIDRLMEARWKQLGVKPAPLADDAEFLRRVYLDLTGRIPRVSEARAFLDDTSPDKRQRLIEEEKSKPQNERSEMDLIEKLKFVTENRFERITYTEAIDILLHRIPARFIVPSGFGHGRKGGGASVEAALSELATGLGPEDAFVIFPEGGQVSPQRRSSRIKRLRDAGREAMAERAEAMTHVMAPQPGGMHAALDAAPDAEHPGEQAGADAREHDLEELGAHRTSSWTATTTRNPAKAKTRTRAAIRSWSQTPATTPATAGRPIVAASSQ